MQLVYSTTQQEQYFSYSRHEYCELVPKVDEQSVHSLLLHLYCNSSRLLALVEFPLFAH